MFRPRSQPISGLQALTHVAWGTSLGGLVLLAEERRRRVALAQKIVENGRRLQAYKSYGAVAAIAEFDLGHDWDDTQHFYSSRSNEAVEPRSLTNEEWRTRRRSHRRLPTAPIILDATDTRLDYRATEIATAEASLNNGPKATQQPASSFIPRPTSSTAIKSATIDLQTTPSNLTSSRTNVKDMRYSPSYTLKRSLVYQKLIADRVIECFSTNDARLRQAGLHELSVYFKEVHHDLGKDMKRAVHLAWKVPREEQHAYLSYECRAKMTRSVKVSQDHPHEAVVTTEQTNLDQSGFVEHLMRSVKSMRLDSAFYEFLAMCEQTTEPLQTNARWAINRLIGAFKTAGLHSVVSDILTRGFGILHYGKLIRRSEDIQWLFERGTSASSIKFCRKVIGSTLKAADSQGLRTFSNIALDWFAKHAPPKDVMTLLDILDDLKLELGGKIDNRLKLIGRDITQQAFQRSNLEDAANILLWRAKQDISEMCTPRQLKLVLAHLISVERFDDAVDLFVAADLKSETKLDVVSSFGLDQPHTVRRTFCNTLVAALFQRQRYESIVRLERGMNVYYTLNSQSRVLAYHAFSRCGPLTESAEVLTKMHRDGIDLSVTSIQDSHARLLRRCWRETRNLQLVEEVFKDIRALIPTANGTHIQFDAMIHACVEAGEVKKAEEYAEMMIDANLTVTTQTMSKFMLIKAIEGDWDEVDSYMLDLKQRAQQEGAFDEIHPELFDDVYTKYCEQRSAAEAVAYAQKVIEMFDLKKISAKMVGMTTDLIVKGEDIQLLQQWADIVKQKYEMFRLSSEAISLLLYRIVPLPSLKYQEALQSENVLQCVVDAGSYDLNKLSRILKDILPAETAKITRRRKFEPVEASVRMEALRKNAKQDMLRALAIQDFDEAVSIYKKTAIDGLPSQPVNLQLLLAAAFQADQTWSDDVQNVLEAAQEAGMDMAKSDDLFFLQSLRTRELSKSDAHDIVFGNYRSLDEKYQNVYQGHYLTLAAARNLFMQGSPSAAIRLLRDVRASEYCRRAPFSITGMTLMLRILIKMGDAQGVQEIVQEVLDRDLRIDKDYIQAIKQGRQLYGDNAEGHSGKDLGSDETRLAFHNMLERCLEYAKARRVQQRVATIDFARQALEVIARHRTVGDGS